MAASNAGQRARDQAGLATVVLPMLLWLATLAAIALIDLGAYLVAASRAQTLADAAALAAVSAEATLLGTPGAHGEAQRVVAAGGGVLEHCACRPGSHRARVAVSVEVPGLVIPRLGAGRVVAEAAAVLVEPVELPLGPVPQHAARLER